MEEGVWAGAEGRCQEQGGVDSTIDPAHHVDASCAYVLTCAGGHARSHVRRYRAMGGATNNTNQLVHHLICTTVKTKRM